MNTIKFALLGTAALAAVSVSAQASTTSDIAALKAQVEALSAQVAANEAQSSVPAGFQLVTVSQQPAIVVPGVGSVGRDVTTIAIVPTADAPASTVIQWSGFARAALVYQDYADTAADPAAVPPVLADDNIRLDVKARGQINVVGKTDTAVGEVGAQMSVRGNWNGSNGAIDNVNVAQINNAWGWWKMTPDLTLAGGFNGSLSGIGYGYDGACSCYYTDNAAQGTSLNGDVAQMRLTYASGPMSVAVAIEDGFSAAGVPSINNVAVAAKVSYTGDMFNAALSGGYHPSVGTPEAKWVVNAGVGFALGDIGKISASGTIGSNLQVNDNIWKASILGSLNLSDQAHLELGYGHARFDNAVAAAAFDQDAILAGLYYEPVSQLTIGLEGEWFKNSNNAQSNFSADLVTVFRF
jgi:hypothetical protein